MKIWLESCQKRKRSKGGRTMLPNFSGCIFNNMPRILEKKNWKKKNWTIYAQFTHSTAWLINIYTIPLSPSTYCFITLVLITSSRQKQKKAGNVRIVKYDHHMIHMGIPQIIITSKHKHKMVRQFQIWSYHI